MNVFTSSSLTRLSAALADSFTAAPAHPLVRETVVTLSTGMGRWLSMELATSLGVCAGVDFRFPNDTLDECFRTVIPGIPETSPFALDTMAWRIAALLPDFLHLPAFAPITAYLGDLSDDRRLLQLSRSLADTFDQYTIFRPQMILDWDRGAGSDWQAELWRTLTADCAGLHRAALLHRFKQTVESGTATLKNLPARISLFGISFLPPFHLEVFSLLARHIEVNIYLCNPCGSFWGDLYSEKRKASLALSPELPVEALEFYETGNTLLSSLGTQGQEFFNLLLDFDPTWTDLDDDQLTGSTTLLGTIQRDIRELVNRGTGEAKTTVAGNDRSLEIHSCHGPLREMEILYDNLLSMFDELPGLEPRSVVVMTPDMESYAPYINAVFGTSSGGRPAIPFTIADQSARADNPLIETFLTILKLPASRCGINGIMEILETPHILRRFEISADDLAVIRDWVTTSGVRWGLDAEHRASLGFPAYNEYSWRAGLDRLLLGYALAPGDGRLFDGMLPHANIEGRQAVILGKLAGFLDSIALVRTQLANSRTLPEWADILTAVADRMLLPLNANDTGCSALYGTFQNLRDISREAGFVHRINMEAVTDHLGALLDSGGTSSGYLNGRVTFCAMLPMRSIPQRVICLVGMNDSVFPRNPRQPGFSLMNGTRRRGDRSVRDEDRYLFLEAVMSASERLYISHTGQNDRDNSIIPPSVVVSELLDYVDRGFCRHPESPESPPDIVIRHRLQGFSPAYFSSTPGTGLFSYSTYTCAALVHRRSNGRTGRICIRTPLADAPRLLQQLDVTTLVRFLCNPARAFLTQRMNINPYDPADEIDEREPFALDNLSSYGLKQQLVTDALSGMSPDARFSLTQAASILPPLRAGHMAFDTLQEQSSAFSRILSPHLLCRLEPLQLAFDVNGTLLTGTLADLQQNRHVRWRYASMKGTDLLSIWVEHLILNTVRPSGYPRESMLICKDLTVSLAALGNAAEVLADLVALFREGMSRPLHFFPQSSWLYLTHGMGTAESRWLGTDYTPAPAESADPSNSLCHSGSNVLDEEFIRLAERVYRPLKGAATEGKTQ